jgi:hypothetical protein
MSKQQVITTLDKQHKDYQRLMRYAARIAALLQHRGVKTDDELKGSLDELLGSVYSLVISRQLEYDDRIDKPKDDQPILDRAQQLGKGEIRMDGKWMAGYYMNSSTYRTASVHHRILKIITGKDGRADAEKDIRLDYPTWTGGKVWNADNLDKVRREANDLKHTEEGLYPSRGLTYEQALLAIDEILTLTEVWLPHKK